MANTDIVDLGPERIGGRGVGHRLAERTYLDRDGKATTDPVRGVRLLGPAGRVVPAQAARDAGLVVEEQRGAKAADEPAAKIAGTPEAELEQLDKPKRRTTRNKKRDTAKDK